MLAQPSPDFVIVVLISAELPRFWSRDFMNSLEGPSMTMQEFHGAVLEVLDEDLHQGFVVILRSLHDFVRSL